MKKENYRGFSPEDEQKYLGRLSPNIREKNLEQELKTQLAEDFGLVEFTLKYKFQDDILVHVDSCEGLVELTSRGGVEEETESIKKIEEGLRSNPEKTWIHFSPQSEKYPNNCIDVWRRDEDEVIWNRIVINNDFEEMNRVRKMLGEVECQTKKEIVASPISVEMKLSEIFDLFSLSDGKYYQDFSYIEKIVKNHLDEFSEEFGEKLTRSSELIYRLYSACHKFLKVHQDEETIIDRRDLENFMYGEMLGKVTEKSFGCSGVTTVGSFGERVGYYVSADGKINFGKVPDEYKHCKKCDCYYIGDKCPFC